MRRSFAFLLLTIAAATANAAIQFSPELPVADPHPAASRADPRPHAVATDGTDFLVVWLDSGGLKTTIVAADGTVPDEPSPAYFAPGAAVAFGEISAVWTGSVYLVTWYGGDAETSMYAATFAFDGTLVRAPYPAVDKAGTISGALAHAGHRSLQIYLRHEINDFRAALFDDDGSLVAADLPLPAIPLSGPYMDLVRIASDGSEFALVWRTPDYVLLGTLSDPPPLQQRFDTFHLQRIRGDGTLDGEALTIGRVEFTQSFGVASGDGRFAIVTTEYELIVPGQTRPLINRWIVDGKTVTALPKIQSQGGDSVVWTGVGFVAYGLRYSPFGTEAVLTVAFSGGAEVQPPLPRMLLSDGAPWSPHLAATATTLFGAWTQTTGSTSAVYGGLLDRTASTFEKQPFLVSISWSRQFNPGIATSGSESLLAWVDETGGVPQGGLVGVRLTLNGHAIDRTPLSIASATITGRPVVMFNGRMYIVVWTEGSDGAGVIRMRTVSRDGSRGPVVDLGIGWGVTAASNSATSLVAFTEVRSGNIVGYRLGPDADQLDAQPLVLGSGWLPSAATNGTDFFVAWNVGSDYFQWPPPDFIDVLGVHVGANGAVDAAPVAVATGPPNQVLGAVASDGRDYVIFYSSFSNAGAGLAAKRVLRDGGLVDTTPMEPGPIAFGDVAAIAGARYALAVTRDETGFWLAWPSDLYLNDRIILVHTDANGTGGEPMEIVPYADWELPSRVALAKPPHGSLQIAYTRPVRQGKYAGTSQVFLRFAGEPANRWRAAGH